MRKTLIFAFLGLSIKLQNYAQGTKATLTFEDTGEAFDIDEYGMFWRMLPEGQYTVTVKVDGYPEMTKVTRVLAQDFNEVIYALPLGRRAAILPGFVSFTFLAIVVAIVFGVCFYCRFRRRAKTRRQRSYNGFEILARDERNLFHDEVDDESVEEPDEEDEIEFLNRGENLR